MSRARMTVSRVQSSRFLKIILMLSSPKNFKITTPFFHHLRWKIPSQTKDSKYSFIDTVSLDLHLLSLYLKPVSERDSWGGCSDFKSVPRQEKLRYQFNSKRFGKSSFHFFIFWNMNSEYYRHPLQNRMIPIKCLMIFEEIWWSTLEVCPVKTNWAMNLIQKHLKGSFSKVSPLQIWTADTIGIRTKIIC